MCSVHYFIQTILLSLKEKKMLTTLSSVALLYCKIFKCEFLLSYLIIYFFGYCLLIAITLLGYYFSLERFFLRSIALQSNVELLYRCWNVEILRYWDKEEWDRNDLFYFYRLVLLPSETETKTCSYSVVFYLPLIFIFV